MGNTKGNFRRTKNTLRGVMAVGALVLLPCLFVGQVGLTSPGESGKPDQATLRGRPAVDVMPGIRAGLGFPLRYGNVVPGTVRVEVDTTTLTEGKEFTLDYPGGILYLSFPVKESQSIRVSYRHDPGAKQQRQAVAFPVLALNMGSAGGVKMLLGAEGAQRMADGTLVRSNNAGLQNDLKFGGGNLRGVFLVSMQSKSHVLADGSSPDSRVAKNGENATDKLIMQSFSMDAGGVKLTADYQDVGRKFGAFGMLEGTGVSDQVVKQLEKEKGLRRFAAGLSAENIGGLSFANSFRTIDDGRGKIIYQNYGLKSPSFEIYYNAREIEASFERFNDIAEADREQLKKERGINREAMGGALRFGTASLRYDQASIGDRSGGVLRKTVAFDSDVLKATFSTQKVGEGFRRVGDLAEAEKAQWAKERGMQRQSIVASTGSRIKGVSASFEQRNVSYGDKDFSSLMLNFRAGRLGVEYWERSTEPGFARLGDLSQPELDAMIQQTLRMYDPNAGVNVNDRGFITREGGLSRKFLRVTAEPLRGVAMRYESGVISSGLSGIFNTGFGLQTKSLRFEYRKQSIDKEFRRVHDLLEAERRLYGVQTGFNRVDMALDLSLNSKTSVGLTQLRVDSEQGGVQRLTGQAKGPGFEFKGAYREVDRGFSRAGDINDAEKDLFFELVGYKQYDAYLKFDAIRNFRLEGFVYDAANAGVDLHRYKRLVKAVYTPDAQTKISLDMFGHKFDGGTGTFFENNLLSVEAFRDFGKFGRLTLRREEESYGGTEATRPDRETYYGKYETKLTKVNELSVEQMRTRFSDGGYENLQAYKLSWQVNSRLNLNVTEIFLDRDGAKPDVRTRNYGATYDLGNNMKLTWTWFRDLNPGGGGKRSSSFKLTPGSLFGFDVGGSYSENQLDGQRTSAIGVFSISNPKPFNWGPLRDVKIKVGYDSETDKGFYKKETRLADFSATAFGAGVQASYAHVMLPNQKMAVDRTLRFTLDPSGKRPLQVNLIYKFRTMPSGIAQHIRDYDIKYQLGKQFKLSHSLETLPEKAQNNVPLGSVAQPVATNNWAIQWTPNGFASATLGFQEKRQFDQRTLDRSANVSISLLNNTGNPVRLTYAMEQNHEPTGRRFTKHMYELAYDQRPGPNQALNFVVGYWSWEHGIADGKYWTNWSLRLDYQVRF